MMRQYRWWTRVVLVVGVTCLLLQGCESGDNGSDGISDISGNWSLAFTFTHDACFPNNVNKTIQMPITIHQDGQSFWFTLQVNDPPIAVQVDGTILPDGAVSFGFADTATTVQFQWTGTVNGNVMSGTFAGRHEDGPQCTHGGNWTATRL